mgnify:CR=1 FL=1
MVLKNIYFLKIAGFLKTSAIERMRKMEGGLVWCKERLYLLGYVECINAGSSMQMYSSYK